MKKLTSLLLAILLLLTTPALAEPAASDAAETWYAHVFGQVVTLTLMDDGTYHQTGAWNDGGAWTGGGTWTKDADGNVTLCHSDTAMTLQKTDAGLLATLNGTDTVQFLLTSDPDTAALSAEVRHDATLADFQGTWEARTGFAQSLCLPADTVSAETRRIVISGTTLMSYQTPVCEYVIGQPAQLKFTDGVLYSESGVTDGEPLWFSLLEDGRMLFTTRIIMKNGIYREKLYSSYIMERTEVGSVDVVAYPTEAEVVEVTPEAEYWTNPRNDESQMNFTKMPETVEVWYGTAFGRQITLTLRDNGEYEESTGWHGYGTWEKDADGNLTLDRSDRVLTLQKTDAGLLATLIGTDTVQFLLTKDPDATALAADVRHDATLDDLQGDWESSVNFVQSLCLCAARVNSTTRRLTISGTELRNLTSPGDQFSPEDVTPLTFADGVLSGVYKDAPMQFALLEDGRLLFLEVVTLGEGDDTEDLYVYYIMKHPDNNE